MTRNKRDNYVYSGNMHIHARYLAIPTMVLLATMMLPLSYAQTGIPDNLLLKITAKSWKNITVIKVENSADNIYNSKLIWFTLQNGVIESYKPESGWIAESSSTNSNTVQFRTDTNPLKPGESVRFGIKSDQMSPIFSWIIIDEDGDELGSGTLDVIKSMMEEAEREAARATGNEQTQQTQPPANDSPTTPPTNGQDRPSTPDIRPAIAMVPDTAKPGLIVRLLGEGFTPNSRLTVLFDGRLIETLRTASDGTIRDRIQIPESAVPGAHQIAVEDAAGRAANLPISVIVEERTAPLFTVATERASYRQGELVKITGIGNAGAAVSLRVVDPASTSIFSSAVAVNREGTYTAFVPLNANAVTGEYQVSALQEGRTITTTFRVITETGYDLSILTDKHEYKQGESVIISGQAQPNKDIVVRVLNPNGTEVFNTTIKSDSTGKFTSTMIVPAEAQLGRYSAVARVDSTEITLTFTVVRGSIVLTVQTDKTEYREGELVRISGKGKPLDRVTITILTAKEDRIPMSANTREDGTYSALWLVPQQGAVGTYQVIVQQGESRVQVFFAVFR